MVSLRPIISLTAGTVLIALLAGCGHRGPLYVPGKPGDPAYDREHKGETMPAPGTLSAPTYNDDDRTVKKSSS